MKIQNNDSIWGSLLYNFLNISFQVWVVGFSFPVVKVRLKKSPSFQPFSAVLTLPAFHIGVPSLISRQALATSNMVARRACSIQTTGLETTCILAASLVTNLGITTFIVPGTLGLHLYCGRKKSCISRAAYSLPTHKASHLARSGFRSLPQIHLGKSRQPSCYHRRPP